ncbi:hypothetical protein [Nocardia spumae]|uniref:hypothetical protein n=1 Tax=Nocardia spumae TaxID=2887190 RepID=UPI001D14FAEB|nr:hypothetical protein [Nocardia spumae]
MTTETAFAPGIDLRTALRIDGWSTGVFGVVLLAAAYPLRGPLGLPATWSVPFGVGMLGGAAALLLIAGYPHISHRMAAAVVAVNLVSALALIALACADLLALTGLGIAFLLIGALVVALFAELEYLTLRRERAAQVSSSASMP